MKQVLVTGARGFIGRNLCAVLKRIETIDFIAIDIDDSQESLEAAIRQADYIFHLAGVNRPIDPEEFETCNAGLVERICQSLRELRRAPKIVLSSSIQADLDNPYGISKRHAEVILKAFAAETGAECVVYRLKNLFGKWCRHNYNSVTATLCHNIANNLPIEISNRNNTIDLTHIDDVVAAFVAEMDKNTAGFSFAAPLPSTKITLGQLEEKLIFYKKMRSSLLLPDFSNNFDKALYGTYLSYLDKKRFNYNLDIKFDQRGSLAEFIKSPSMGQIFISRTEPGITRGNHYHNTKTEKFLVLQGTAVIRLRHIENSNVIEYTVQGESYQVVDIPPGYTHSIKNIGQDEVLTLFWASEPFDPENPDTYFEPVQGEDYSCG